MIEKEKMESAKAVCEGQTILELKPFVHKKVGIVTTGNEVYYHRIEDTFTPVIKEKLAEYDTEVIGQVVCNDCLLYTSFFNCPSICQMSPLIFTFYIIITLL